MDDMTIMRYIEAINERLRRLEGQIETLSERVGVPFASPTAALPPDVVELARANKRIEAIKRYRELTNASLEEARQVVMSI
jgi:ribosomal protein L7/L12